MQISPVYRNLTLQEYSGPAARNTGIDFAVVHQLQLSGRTNRFVAMGKKQKGETAPQWIELSDSNTPGKAFQECIVSVEGDAETQFAKWYEGEFISVYTRKPIEGVTHFMIKPHRTQK